jgi:hypothetical protein
LVYRRFVSVLTRSDLESRWSELGIDFDGATLRGDGTLVRPPASERPGTAGNKYPSMPPNADAVELGELIGEGGMGRVHVGRQHALKREVAVKTPHSALDETATMELLREARITGALQHPSVVPIHTVGTDDSGRPLVVMKRLTGVAWAERLLLGAANPAELDKELGVVEQIANVLAFAHDRRVLHRDIKPDNVMLGEFGEVYLVDWGLAVGLEGAEIPDLPPAARVCEVAGTLQYMAPEMAAALGESFSPATDVYLLGATLYEVLTGAPPHQFSFDDESDVKELLFRVVRAERWRLPGWVPAELAAICRKALALAPEDRFADGREFRDALASFRQHRQSLSMMAEAQQKLDAAGRLDGSAAGEALAQARFGFEQSLRSWPDNARAQERLEQTLVALLERAIAAQHLGAAVTLLGQLEDPGPDCRAEVARLREELTAKKARITALEAAAEASDMGRGAQQRKWFGIGFAACWLAVHCVLGWLHRASFPSLGHLGYVAVTGVVAALFGFPALVFHRRVYPNAANRRFAGALALLLLGQVATFLAMGTAGVALEASMSISLVQLAFACAIITLMFARRVLPASLVTLLAAYVSSVLPALVFEMVGVSYATYFVVGSFVVVESNPEGRPKPTMLEGLNTDGRNDTW